MNIEGTEWWFILAILTEILLLIVAVGWALVRAARMPYPGLLVTSLSLLALMLLVVYTITESTDVITLIGVPLGALATAMSGVFKPDPNLPPTVTKTTVTEQPSGAVGGGAVKTTVVEKPISDSSTDGVSEVGGNQ